MSGASLDAAARGNAALWLHIALFAIGAVALAAMSIAAHNLAYFPVDVGISRLIQAFHPGWLNTATDALSWTGFPPQSDVLFGVIVVVLFALGHRLAAVAEVLAAVGSGELYLVLQQVVGRSRPSADLVLVAWPLQMGGFPSGHVATFTAVLGFLAFLGYCGLHASRMRWLPVGLVAMFLVLMSFARIYAGQHWASDALAGYLLGGLWLAVIIRLYTWGEAHLARGRPTAGSAAREKPALVTGAELSRHS
jgi:membrane-associated phospholipid phosphatase